MELGMVGLGRMGANIVERLLTRGHRIVAFDRDAGAVKKVSAKGAIEAESLAAFVQKLTAPRAIWLMVPAGEPVDQTIDALIPILTAGDTVVDGGNSNYKDTLRRGRALQSKGLHLVDAGTSGGIWGLKEGYSLMVGGDRQAVEPLRPIFEALAPSPDAGWGHVGPSGAGHFVKMIHNGIEYGLMQAYGEGFAIMKQKEEFHLDLAQITGIWRHSSVIRSWLLDLIDNSLTENPDLAGIAPYVEDSGEGRWTVEEAISLDVPAPVITLSLLERLRSREQNSFADRLLAALRNQFGGHAVKQEMKRESRQ